MRSVVANLHCLWNAVNGILNDKLIYLAQQPELITSVSSLRYTLRINSTYNLISELASLPLAATLSVGSHASMRGLHTNTTYIILVQHHLHNPARYVYIQWMQLGFPAANKVR